jgi:hypothetical protein
MLGPVRPDERRTEVGHRLQARTPDGRGVAVDGRDVAQVVGLPWTAAAAHDPAWAERADRYVAEHPRTGSSGIGPAQRLALLRRLAAGPASTAELLAALRRLGWVGASDLENRLRDLRATGRRAGAVRTGLSVVSDGDRHRFAEPFPALAEPDLRALGFAKAMVDQLHGPLPAAASAALEHLVPGLAAGRGPGAGATYRARARDFERFEEARVRRRAVQIRYFSLNSGAERSYLLVPVEYVTLGATVKAICVQVGPDGRRVEDDERQFAMDRLLAVEVLADQPTTPPRDLRMRRTELVLDVSAALYEILRQRDIFGLGEATGEDLGYDDTWRVRGRFPHALAWDVMEQLCAWSGQVQVREPLWLVNAVVRRLRAGLRVMEQGAAFELVKPEPDRVFADHGEAVTVDEPLPARSGPRKLAPR